MLENKFCNLGRFNYFFYFQCRKRKYFFSHINYFRGALRGRQPLKGKGVLSSKLSIRRPGSLQIFSIAELCPLPIPRVSIFTWETPNSLSFSKTFLAASWAARGVAFFAPL